MKPAKYLLVLVSLLVLALLLMPITAIADDSDEELDYPWRSHAEPFAFTFGNMIDSHQQSRLVDGDKLHGFLYVHDTGDLQDGLPVTERANCNPTSGMVCRVGWRLKGKRISAQLVHVAPRIWLVDPASLPKEPGYHHFQWVGDPHSPHDLVVGEVYEGFVLKRVAPLLFFWIGGSAGGGGGCGDHESDSGDCGGHDGDTGGDCGSGGQSGGHAGRIVPEGVDPHKNIVTSWDGSWTGGGGCGGHEGDTGGCEQGDTGDCAGGRAATVAPPATFVPVVFGLLCVPRRLAPARQK